MYSSGRSTGGTAAALLGVLLAALSVGVSRAQDMQFASENIASDRWGPYDQDFMWQVDEQALGDWSVDDDWPTYGSYYTDDLRAGYGGAYGRYDWTADEWRFNHPAGERTPYARHVEWRSDRYGVYERGYAWESDAIGLQDWSAKARRDWLDFADSGDPGWFDF